MMKTASAPPMGKLTIIKPRKGWSLGGFKGLYQHRELLYFLVWRDIKARHKQTFLGVFWAILKPVTQMAVFSVFLGAWAKVPSGGLPYPVFVYAGLLPWMLFSSIVSQGGSSLISSSSLITKIYFPRIIIPLSASASALLDFLIASVVLAALMLIYGILPGMRILLIPLLILVLLMSALGLALLVSALSVVYRDFIYVIPFVLQVGMFVTPVIYHEAIVPAKWRGWFYMNPLAGVIGAYRSAVFDRPINLTNLGISIIAACVLLAVGLAYFNSAERTFADVV